MFFIWSQERKLLVKEAKEENLKDHTETLKIIFESNDFKKICNIIKEKTMGEFYKQNKFDNDIDPVNTISNIIIKNQKKFLDFLRKEISLLKKALSEKENSYIRRKISSSSLDSFKINQNNNPVLLYKKIENKSKKSDYKELIEIITANVNQYKKIIEKIPANFQKNNENLFSDYFKKDMAFFTDLNNIINTDFSKDLSESNTNISLLNSLSLQMKKLSEKLSYQLYFNSYETNKYWTQLLNISKCRTSSQNSIFIILIDLISKLYEKYIGTSPIIQSFQEFLSYYYGTDPKINNKSESIHKKIYDLITDISKTKKNYYLDHFIEILLENILNSKLIKEKIDEKKSTGNGSDFIDICDVEIFSNSNYSCKLFYDNDLHFYLRKNFSNPDNFKREFEFFNKLNSKFIVVGSKNYKNQPSNTIVVPFYSNGTLHDLITKQKINLSNVDKLIFILEIATAINDLHKVNKCHGHLTDKKIYISSDLNAYLGSFSYSKDKSIEEGDIYFQSPKKVNSNNVKEEKVDDIYAFGVLAYEISSEKFPDSNIQRIPLDKKKEKLSENYLLTEINENYFDENTTDLRGDSIIGLKDIIIKCIEKKPKEMSEIINLITQLPFYKDNENEISYRLKNAIDADKYCCKLSNIVESYFRGSKDCFSEVIDFLYVFNKNVLETKNLPIYYTNDLIRNIFEVLNLNSSNENNLIENKTWMNNLKINERWKFLLDKAKYHIFQTKSEFKDDLNSILNYYYYDLNNFMIKYKYDESNKKVFLNEIIEEVQLNGNYYLIDKFYQDLISNLANSNFLSCKFHETMENDSDKTTFEIKKLPQFGDSCSSYALYCDQNMKFYLQKFICKDNNFYVRNLKEKEEKILYDSYDHLDFVAYSDSNIDSNNNQDVIYIPYFPLGTLNNFISNQAIKITNIDKIVIILEISMAIKDLHSRDIHHEFLSDKSIFINSKLDAYIGEIYKNSNYCYFKMPEKLPQNSISKDIYSLGVIMYEIATCLTPENLMKGLSVDKRNEIIENNYKNFLFSSQIEYFLFNETKDSNKEKESNKTEDSNKTKYLNGDNLTGLKEIIDKCIDNDQNKRFKNIDEVIKKLKKLQIYLKYEAEIEYRIKDAFKPTNYNCVLSDIFYCYYRGQNSCYDDIEKFIQFYNQKLNFDLTSPKYEIKEDLLESVLKIFNLNSSIRISIDNKIFDLISKAINQTEITIDEIFSLFDDLEYNYGKYIGYSFVNSTLAEFIDVFNNDKDNIKLKQGTTKDQFIQAFNEVQQKGKYFYIFIFFHILINEMLNFNIFKEQYQSALDNNNINNNKGEFKLYEISEMKRLNEISSSYVLKCDNKMFFNLAKTYDNKVGTQIITREQHILSDIYSKYIVHLDRNKPSDIQNKIIISYFPNGSIENIFYNPNPNTKTKDKFVLNDADKITLILEIAIGLNDLHSKNGYHGNLSDQFIFINHKRDAYIGSFCYDPNSESDSTKPKGPQYYRSREYLLNHPPSKCEDLLPKDHTISKEELKDFQSYDIYAFGVLMHEILTEQTPESRFGNAPRKDKLTAFFNGYKDFLFSKGNNDFFENEAYEIKDEKMKSFKEIIEKCLSQDPKDRYSTMKEIIESIKKTHVYLKNKTEIEYRIEHSIESRNFECTLPDIVESYYQGQSQCFDDIEKFLLMYQKDKLKDALVQFSVIGDLIKNIYECFNVKLDQDSASYFDDIFDIIIQNFIIRKIKIESTIDNQNRLLTLSIEKNRLKHQRKIELTGLKSDKINNFIIPITTLDNFIKHNKNQISNLIPTWIYILAKELQYIHSKNIYHGSLSPENIGIYYNNETQTFIPSFILFYSFYELSKEKNSINTNTSQQSNSKAYKIQKKKQKDVKKLIQIIKEFNEIPDDLMKLIESYNSINKIVTTLYEFFKKTLSNERINIFDKNLEKNKMDNYYSFHITYPILRNIFISNESKFSFQDSFIELDNIISILNEFLENTKINPKNSIFENIPQMKSEVKKATSTHNARQQFSGINVKCVSLYSMLLDDLKEKEEEEEEIEIENEKNDRSILKIFDFSEQQKKKYYAKSDNLWTKYVFRVMEFQYICRESFHFLLKRYILMLPPEFKYRIMIKLNHKNDFDYREKRFNVMDDIKEIIKSFPRIKQKPVFTEGNKDIYIYVEEDEEYCLNESANTH